MPSLHSPRGEGRAAQNGRRPSASLAPPHAVHRFRAGASPAARAPSAGCPVAPSSSPRSHRCHQHGFVSTRAPSQRLATRPHVTVCKKKKNQKALLLYLHCTQVSTVQKICRCKYVLPSLTSPPFLIYVISIFLPCTVN